MSSEQELPSSRLCRLWRSRAEECFILANTFDHPQIRDRMLQVAEEYARMALWAADLEDQRKTAKR